MIIYVIPGKTKSAQDAIDYVVNEKKVAKDFDAAQREFERVSELAKSMSFEEYLRMCSDGFRRALHYIQNESKVGGYVTGYLCQPDRAELEFARTKRINLERVGKTIDDDNGNYFYHIIQSFPEDIEITDDEVHECGLELVRRLGLYQAVVASHVHPVIDEEGEPHGKQKHNHIILNSHIYHRFVDEDNPYKMKYHSCRDSYAELQLINDQIAIEHGLPIIAEADMYRAYSWKESTEKNKGKSWKERVRIDISNALRVSEDLDEYMDSIQAAGYTTRLGNSKNHGAYISYTCPDGKHVVRDYILGKGCSLAELQSFWEIKQAIKDGTLENQSDGENVIENLLENMSEPLFIKLKINMSKRRKEELHNINMKKRGSYTHYIPLNTATLRMNAERTYFDAEKIYEIVNESHQTITEISGREILKYYRRISERIEQEKKEEKQRRKEDQYKAYTDSRFYNSATKEPYRISRYDKYGCKRSLIELIIILAMVTIEKEHGKWNPAQSSELNKQEYQRNPIYMKKDWKIQNMYDTVRIAREENIKNLDELKQKINLAGKDLSKCRAEIRRLTESKNRMTTISEAIEEYHELKDLCEEIYAMPDGPEKTKLQQKYTQEIETYKEKKAILYRHKLDSEEKIQDFLERYKEIKENLQRAEEQEVKFAGNSQRLYKLQYNIQLAQNKKYCYGPAYKESLDDLMMQAENLKDPQRQWQYDDPKQDLQK